MTSTWRRRGRSLREPARRVYDWFTGDEFFVTSAALAFYALVSIPPMALVALWSADLVLGGGTLQETVSRLVEQAPEEFQLGPLVTGIAEAAGRAGPGSALLALWPATAYGAALAKGFSLVVPAQERQVQGWKGRLLSLVVVALLPLALAAAVALLFVLPSLLGTGGWLLRLALGAGVAVVFFVLVLAILALFRLRSQPMRQLLLAAAVGTVAQALLTAGYVLYLSLGADFEQTYGADVLAVAVLLGLYLLLSNAALLSVYRYVMRDAGPGRKGRPAEP